MEAHGFAEVGMLLVAGEGFKERHASARVRRHGAASRCGSCAAAAADVDGGATYHGAGLYQ